MSEEKADYYISTEINDTTAKEAVDIAAYAKMVRGIFVLLEGWYLFQTGKKPPKIKDILK